MSDSKYNLQVDRLIAAAINKPISRRRFMEGTTAMGLSVAAAGTLWSERVQAATPKKGGNFRIGIHDGNTTDTHDTGKYQSIGDIHLAHAHRSYLTEITSENDLGPDMANSWSASDDATTWVFELNKDATFHDGRKFTSKDAIASLNHHRGETSSAAAALTSAYALAPAALTSWKMAREGARNGGWRCRRTQSAVLPRGRWS